ncbi:hypothetical protein BJX61DRAFT_512326 [Aspergillus egyptiacus]|nr:hypothetical protein BJX61DRAFT_512326 [Aspergillus egyptiacus]
MIAPYSVRAPFVYSDALGCLFQSGIYCAICYYFLFIYVFLWRLNDGCPGGNEDTLRKDSCKAAEYTETTGGDGELY